jgi:transcriptional regulator with XRE-family HTH domain
MTTKHKAFADQLREVRERAGLSQYALAQKTGLTRQAVSQLELGQTEPTWVTVQLMVLAMEVEFSVLANLNLRLPDSPPLRPRGRPKKGSPEVTVVEYEKSPTKKGKGRA